MFSEAAIQKVMMDTGMDRVQAYRHLRQRAVVATQPVPYPLGKNASIDHDAEYAEWARQNPDLAVHQLGA